MNEANKKYEQPMNDNDIFMAMLQGMDPDKTQQYAQKLRGQQGLSDLFSLSGKKSIAESGKSLGAEALGTATGLGNAAATRKYRDEMMANQQAQMDRADARFNTEQTYRESKDAEDRALKLAIQQMRAQTGTNTLNKEIQQLSKQYVGQNIPQLESAFTDLTSALAPYVDDKGNLKDGLPGAGATGILPLGMLSKDGRIVRQAVSNVRNQVMKMMSGAAVTDPEAARLYEQIGQQLGGSDEDIMRGLTGLKAMADRNRSAVTSGYSNEAVDIYERRLKGDRSVSPQGQGGGSSVSGPAYIMNDPANATLEQMLQMLQEQEDNR